MKKLGLAAAALLVGTSAAFASSINVPWFVDNSPEADGIPPSTAGRVTTLIFLKNTTSEDIVASIGYFDQNGNPVAAVNPDPANAGSNTFTIAAQSALSFRPVATDPDPLTVDPRTGTTDGAGQVGGQEGGQGVLVPDRSIADGRRNGSATISWAGEPTDVQGQITFVQSVDAQRVVSYAHLLPAGV